MSRAVIFDIDGTLIDSVDLHARAWQETLRRYGCAVAFEDVRNQIGKGGDKLMPVFLPARQVEQQGEEIERQRGELFKREYLPQVKPFPCVPELFARLHADGKKIALASSAKGDELATYKRIAGIEPFIEAETSSDDADQSKPEPDIFLAAMDRLGSIDAAEVIVVGDSPYDAEAARKAGLRPIGVLCGGFAPEKLESAGCVALYRDPADLLARYDASPLAI
jgi:HAD superfamily hydrolase (TIGR01549 family)